MSNRWPLPEVEALAADAAALAAARLAALPAKWSAAGCDHEAAWGLFIGAAGEPYQTVVEFTTVAARCSCPSRKYPCKHALALLLLWAAGHVPAGPARLPFAGEWLARRAARSAAAPAREADAEPEAAPQVRARPAGRPPVDPAPPPPDSARDQRAAERMARMAGGLIEFDRWIGDCLRTGLTTPALASYAAWDEVAARLVDAQLGSLANRVRRVGSLVGVGRSWHERVLAELSILRVLAEAGRRLATLPLDLADSVRAALGVTVRQADVLDRAPESGSWAMLGRSDVLEDRIVVRRSWLRSLDSGAWALVLSFAAYGQALADDPRLGEVLVADVHRYPGRHEVRSLIGLVESRSGTLPLAPAASTAAGLARARTPRGAPDLLLATTSLAGACAEVGRALAGVPWLERWPVCVLAAPTPVGDGWALTDHTGSLHLAGVAAPIALVAATQGRAMPIVAEWTAEGLVPLAVAAADRLVDIGPRGGFHERRWRDAP